MMPNSSPAARVINTPYVSTGGAAIVTSERSTLRTNGAPGIAGTSKPSAVRISRPHEATRKPAPPPRTVEQQILGGELSQHRRTRGTNGEPDRDFAAPTNRPSRQQAGEIEARNQQHAADGTNECDERTANRRIDLGFEQRCDGSLPDQPIRRARARRRALHELHGPLEILVGAIERRSRSEPGDDGQPVRHALLEAFRVAEQERRGGQRRPQFAAPGFSDETSGYHADDGERCSIEVDGPPENARIATEPALPQRLRDHDGRCGRPIVREAKTAEERGHAERFEVGRAGDLAAEPLRLAGPGQIDIESSHRRDRLEGRQRRREILKLGIRPPHRRRAMIGEHDAAIEEHEAVRAGIRHRHENRVQDAEHRRVRADTERERGGDRRREQPVVSDGAPGEAQVGAERIDRTDAPRLAAAILDGLGVSDSIRARRTARSRAMPPRMRSSTRRSR